MSSELLVLYHIGYSTYPSKFHFFANQALLDTKLLTLLKHIIISSIGLEKA